MKRLLATIVFLLFAANAHAAGTTYWVKASGGSTGTCGTAVGSADPGIYLRTIAAGLLCLGSGDILSIGAGTYVEGVYSITGSKIPSGTAANYTIIKSTSGSADVFLAPSTTAPGETAGIYLQGNHSYIRFTGIGTDGVNHASLDWPGCCGVQLAGDSIGSIHHIEILNGEFKNNKCGSMGFNKASDVLIRGNYIHGDTCNSYAHGFYVGDSTERFTIDRNRVTGMVQYGMQVYSTTSPFPRDHVISNNIFWSNGNATNGGSGISAGGENTQVFGNIVYSNYESGIRIQYANASNVLVYNNTAYANGEYGIFNNTGGSSAVIKNNLAIGNSAGQIQATSGTVASNITTGTASSHFVNAGGGDFTLISTSTAINAGTATISGSVTVPGNTTPDAGAHQKLGGVTCEVGVVAANILACEVVNNVFPPILPAASITGITNAKDGVDNPVTANSRQGTNGFRATLTNNFTAGQACTFAYSQTGNITDSALIGNTSNQELFAFGGVGSPQSCTNNVSGPATATVTQSHAAMFAWDGNEGSGAQIGSTNSTTALRAMVHAKYLARIGLKTTVADTAATNYALRYSKNGGAYAVVPTFTGSEDVGICDAPSVSAGSTTQRLTSGGFTAGRVVEIGAGIPTLTMTNGQSTELLYPICYGPNLVANTDNVKLRIYKDDGTALAYDTNATLNVDVVSPSLAGL